MEIERKFLLAADPPLPTGSHASRLRQGYVAVASDRGEVRVRDEDGACTLTVKQGAGLTRAEHEVSITPDLFAELWPHTEGRRLEKIRHRLPLERWVAEVDVFAGDLDGLRLVEIEFATEDDAVGFVPPAWFGLEVTADPRYKNQSLALDGAPSQA
jgi:CYTH domain-containing protein